MPSGRPASDPWPPQQQLFYGSFLQRKNDRVPPLPTLTAQQERGGGIGDHGEAAKGFGALSNPAPVIHSCLNGTNNLSRWRRSAKTPLSVLPKQELPMGDVAPVPVFDDFFHQ